jgi:hypothetical protein
MPLATGAPHRLGLSGTKRREVKNGAAVEDATEVWQPALGHGRRDDVERRPIEGEQDDAALRRSLDRREVKGHRPRKRS